MRDTNTPHFPNSSRCTISPALNHVAGVKTMHCIEVKYEQKMHSCSNNHSTPALLVIKKHDAGEWALDSEGDLQAL